MNWLTIALGTVCGIIGLAVLALCIQNGKKIAAWRTARRAKKAATRAATVAAATGRAPITAAKKRDWKKQFETGIAFAKLAALLVFIGVLFVFLVGPKYFWGDYYAPPPQAPAAQAARAQAIYPNPFGVTAQPGNPQNPSAPWSAPIAVNGRRFSADVQGTDTAVPMAVLADGVVHIIAPGLRPHIGAPQEIRFLSLTNFPLHISGIIE